MIGVTSCAVCGYPRPLGYTCPTCYPLPSPESLREPLDVSVSSSPIREPHGAGDTVSSTQVALSGRSPRAGPVEDTTPGPATCVDQHLLLAAPSPAPVTSAPARDVATSAALPVPATVRQALDAKDALLRRALAMVRGVRLAEDHRLVLEGCHLGDVSALIVAIEVEAEYADPLEPVECPRCGGDGGTEVEGERGLDRVACERCGGVGRVLP